MTTSLTAGVQVLDLRGLPDGQPHEAALGRVIVLDHAGTLVDHWDTYLALANDPQVFGVVCIALGEPPAPGGNGTHSPVMVRVPGVLARAGGAVLWVGDEEGLGVQWGSSTNQPVPVRARPDEPSSLDRLVVALHVEEVFDAVRAHVQDMPGQVASPGTALFSGAVVAGQLGAARDGALQELLRVWHDQAPTQELRDTIEDLARGPQARPGGDLEGRVAVARKRASDTRIHAENLARDAGSLRVLTGNKERGGERPGPFLGLEVARSGQSMTHYRAEAVELLDRIDGHLRRGDTTLPQVVEMGVREPIAVPPEQVVEDLRPAIAAHLAKQPSLPTLSRHLRQAAAALEPAGCPGAAEEASAGGPLERGLPKETQWPVSRVLLPLVLLTCFVAALVPTPTWLGFVVGLLAAIAWFVPAWMLLGRWPQSDGELELGEAAVPAGLSFGLTGIAGLALGVVVSRYLDDLTDIPLLAFLPEVPTRWRVYIVVALFLIIVVSVWSSWRLAARRLRAQLGTRELADLHGRVSRLVDGVVGREWVPSARRRQLASALNETADGLHEIQRRLEDPHKRLFTGSPERYSTATLPGGVPNALGTEVRRVVRDDLLRIVRTTLDRAWSATLNHRRNDPGAYKRRLEPLLTEYDTHVKDYGLLTLPRRVDERDPEPDPQPRRDLLAGVWSDAPQARAALLTQPFADMTQLCTARQLRDLSTFAEPVMVRFAPEEVRRMLAGGDARDARAFASLVGTDRAELAGVVRLLELQAGARETVVVGGER